MENNYSGSDTERALYDALSDESKAHVRYMLFADTARNEGYGEVAGIFDEYADNELTHAKLWLDELNSLGDTKQNVMTAIGEETADTITYPEFAETAEKEGYSSLAERFRRTAEVEASHKAMLEDVLERIDADYYKMSPEEILWKCSCCGLNVPGITAPGRCPLCGCQQRSFVRG